MKSQSNLSQVAEEHPFSGPTSFDKKKAHQVKYVSYKDAIKNQNEPLMESDHSSCLPVSTEWKIEEEDKSLISCGISKLNEKSWLIDRPIASCCMQMNLDVKVLVKKNMAFSICKVEEESHRQVGVKYVMEHAGIAVRLVVILLEGKKELRWKQIEIPQKSLALEVLYEIKICERPDGVVSVKFNEYSFVFNMFQPHRPNLRMVLRGAFTLQQVALKCQKYTKVNPPSCLFPDCCLF